MNRTAYARKLQGLIPHLASLRISVVCLFLLFVLTAWGTVYQTEAGLYAAQVRFFHSFYFLVWGFLPLPGAQLILWILFLNLSASMFFRVPYRIANIGNILTHFGFLFLLAGSFITYRFAQESFLPLNEKEVSNISLDRRQWELAVWNESGIGIEKNVSTYSLSPKRVGQTLDFHEFGFTAFVQSYYRNCLASPEATDKNMTTDEERIGSLITRRPEQDPEDNLAGAIIHLNPSGESAKKILLFGGNGAPTLTQINGKAIYLELRKVRHPLPITLKLIDVRKEDYPGTGIPRSYHSDIEIEGQGMSQKTRISMNHPFHYKNFTFYQASYSLDEQGRESSVLAVVENSGRLLPYISGTMIFGGMVVHFLMMLFGFNHRKNEPIIEVGK